MQLPIVIDAAQRTTLQQQLVDQFRLLVERKILLPGVQIPSSRQLADQLGLSRRTVVLSYEHMIDDGLIETHAGRGTFVCDQLPTQGIRLDGAALDTDAGSQLAVSFEKRIGGMNLYRPFGDRLPYDFRIGKPDPNLFPRNHWRRLASENLDTFAKAVIDYTDPSGHPRLREAIAKHLRMARGILCRPEQVIVTAGAQEGLNLIARLMNIHGETVIVEDPCYDGAAQTFLSLGGNLSPVRITCDGVDTDALPQDGGRIAYVTPSHQFPLGVTLSHERRVALIAWARRTGTLLVEDDYDSDFRHNSSPLVAMQALGPECVVYLGTFSKSIGPGIRLGYGIFPEHLVDAAIALKSVMNNGHPWFQQAIMAEFISSGAFERHLGQMRTRYVQRRDAVISGLAAAFPDTSTSGYEGGMHLVWETSPDFPTALDLQSKSRQLGVGIYSLAESPTHQHEYRREHDRLVLLGYACLTPEQIEIAIDRLKRMVFGEILALPRASP